MRCKVGKVNTVKGYIDAEQMGSVLVHEHVLFAFPGAGGDASCINFDRVKKKEEAAAVLKKAKEMGLDTFVDATTNDFGRDPVFAREISERTGINIILITGFYNEKYGASSYFRLRNSSEEIYELMKKEITEGIENTGIKAGAVKVASGPDNISDYERMFFVAAARVQRETGIPVITHTEAGNAGYEQARLLIGEGADPSKIMIGHMCDCLDYEQHKKVLELDVFEGFDRFSVTGVLGTPTNEERMPVLEMLLRDGYADKIMLSNDYVLVEFCRERSEDNPFEIMRKKYNTCSVWSEVIPFLRGKGISENTIRQMLVSNPKKFWK